MRQSTRTVIGVAAASLLTVSSIAVATQAGAAGKTTLSSNEALGLSDNGRQLRIFELSDDSDDQEFVGTVSGLAGDDTRLIGIDYWVNTDRFYGVGNGGPDGTGAGVYTIDTKTAALTKVSELTVALEGDHFGIDFNPEQDALRIISDARQNLHHSLAGSTTEDTDLTITNGATGAAFTNNDQVGPTGTLLFDIEGENSQVLLQDHPDDGDVRLAGQMASFIDSTIIGFDIQSKVTAGRTVSNTGYASLRSTDAAQPDLFKIDLLTGNATKVGDFTKQIADIAVKQP